MRAYSLILLAAAVAGCGSSTGSTGSTGVSGRSSQPAGRPASAVPDGRTLYRGGDWAVVLSGDRAVAVHRVGSRWVPDRRRLVKIAILGPRPGKVAPRRPQIAAELTGPSRLVESGLWLDGRELAVKGGGLTPRRGTVYGAPDRAVSPGLHTVVAYARTESAATAIAWRFRVE